MIAESTTDSLDRPEDVEKDPAGVVKRWILELKLADKREGEWRKTAQKVWDRYRQKQAKKHSFNILWSNTETLRPAVYNSLPKPDVRRRWKDEDPIGKYASTILTHALEFGLDTTDFNRDVENAVLDMLLPGRGVARVRYVPSLEQVGVTPETHEEENEAHEEGGEALEGTDEEVSWEQAPIEHVQWDDFRIGAGKTWNEVCWIAFRHRLTRDELIEKFGEDIGNAVKLDSTGDEEIEKEKDSHIAQAFRTAEVWEIWDKDEAEVIFVAINHKDEPLLTMADPLNLQGFFPIPRPLYSMEDSSSLVPTPLFELYREQAEELDRISTRINQIVNGLRLRGVYDATLSELSELMKSQDNDFVPSANVTALLERGGLDKAIWTTGDLVRSGAEVLKVLYEQREAAKSVIYEITGIADIIRGSTVATETATAQQIKDKWGSMRLRKIQAEVARFIRDLIRLQAEIIGEKFDVETLKGMTGVKLPMQAEKEQAMLQYQQQAMAAQQQGQQPPPQPQLPPSWEEVIQVLRDDKQRSFKIDIETDSTVAASLEGEMQGLQQVMGAVSQLTKELGPWVQTGMLPLEALKEIIMAVTRRAKMGNAVEDALDKMQQPPPPPQQQDNSMQVEQMKQQGMVQVKQAELQQTAQIEQMKIQAQGQMDQQKAQIQMQVEQFKAEMQAQNEMQRLEFDKFKAQLDAETKVLVAQIAAEAGAKQAQISAETSLAQAQMQGNKEDGAKAENAEGEASTGDALAVAIQGFTAALEQMKAPRSVIRGPDGRVAGIE